MDPHRLNIGDEEDSEDLDIEEGNEDQESEDDKDQEMEDNEEQEFEDIKQNNGIKIIQETEEVADGKIKDYKLLGIIIAISLILLVGILAIPHFYKQTPKTIDELHQDVLDGKEDADNYMYNGYSFIKLGDENIGYMWYTQIMNPYTSTKYEIPLHYGPKDVEEFMFSGSIELFMNMIYGQNNYLEEYNVNDFNINVSQELYIAYFSFDPESYDLDYINLAHHELATNLAQVLQIRLLPACTKEGDKACESVAILTCENTTVPIIVFEEANGNSIVAKDNCIRIRSFKEGMVKGVDRLLYQMYDIME